jgi:hypothetical protein
MPPIPSPSPVAERRPSVASRTPAPPVLAMNGHFASVGDSPLNQTYEHGIQVIDEEKEFKYVPQHLVLKAK